MDQSDQGLAGNESESPPPDPGRPVRSLLPILSVVLTGFALRLGWLLHARPMPVSDFNDYRTLALDILDHGQFGYPEPTAFFLPVHPIFLSFFALVSRSDLWLGFSMVLVGAMTTFLIYLVGLRTLPSRRAALIAAGMFALFPTFVVFSPVLATEHLHLALMLLVVLALTGQQRLSTRNMVLAGVLLGLAVLTRGEAVFYIPAAVLWIWVGDRSPARRDRLRAILLVGVCVAAVVVPWYVRNAVVVGPEAGLSASAGLNFYFAHNDSGNYGDFIEGNPLHGLPSEEASALGWKLGWEHIRAHPLNLIRDIRMGTFQLFGDPVYAIIWSISGADSRGDPDFYQRPVRYAIAIRDLARVVTPGLFSLAVASFLVFPMWRRAFTLMILPLVLSSWILRTVIYWATPRYAYFITALMVLAAALTVDALLRASRPGEHAPREAIG